MFYSKSKGGFFSPDINPDMPEDSVSLSASEYEALLIGQSNGFVIVGNAAGIPELASRPAAPSPAQPKQFTSLEYLDLFTESEQLAVVSATMAVPQVKLWYDKMLAAGYVTSADPRTGGGLAALVGAGLLTEARKVEILGVMA